MERTLRFWMSKVNAEPILLKSCQFCVLLFILVIKC